MLGTSDAWLMSHSSQQASVYYIEDCRISNATYSCVQKSIENFVLRPKMAIFRRAGMRKGGLPLPLAFQYLILMI
jgi:hypothetical protein